MDTRTKPVVRQFTATASDFLISIRGSDSFGLLKYRCLKYFRSHGVKAMAYHHFPQFGAFEESPSINVISVGFPASFNREYEEQAQYRVDPSIRQVMKSTKANWWTKTDYSSGLRAEERAFLEAARKEVAGHGLILPVFGPLGRPGFVSLGFGHDDIGVGDAELALIQSCCQAAHLQYCELLQAGLPQTVRLSRREQEVMAWVARGKSNGVIAEILGLTENTVITHLRRSYQKLGVHDRVTAALRALSVGELPRH